MLPPGIVASHQTATTGGETRFSQRSGQFGKGVDRLLSLDQIQLRDDSRISSGIHEFDRVLGGGVLPASSILLGGEPGIGKSTLMLQAAAAYSALGEVLYISGEEVPEQIKLRAVRLGVDKAAVKILPAPLAEECVEQILKTKPAIVIVDSIQALLSTDSNSAAGSPNQIKASVQLIIAAARAVNASSFFIAHVTKEGIIAGPKLVEHLVDVVLFFDHSEHELRFLRVGKNRFGSTNEIGLFSMEAGGLREMNEPDKLFLSGVEETPGTAIVPVYEGSRILMVEIQALTVPGQGGFARVYSDKIDQRRVSRIAAVLEKHTRLKFSDQDIYVNVAGGIRLSDVGIELGLAMALYSALTGTALPAKAVFCGELSLSGRIRQVSHIRRRVSHSLELGFSPVIVPPGEDGGIAVSSIVEAIETLLKQEATTAE